MTLPCSVRPASPALRSRSPAKRSDGQGTVRGFEVRAPPLTMVLAHAAAPSILHRAQRCQPYTTCLPPLCGRREALRRHRRASLATFPTAPAHLTTAARAPRLAQRTLPTIAARQPHPVHLLTRNACRQDARCIAWPQSAIARLGKECAMAALIPTSHLDLFEK